MQVTSARTVPIASLRLVRVQSFVFSYIRPMTIENSPTTALISSVEREIALAEPPDAGNAVQAGLAPAALGTRNARPVRRQLLESRNLRGHWSISYRYHRQFCGRSDGCGRR